MEATSIEYLGQNISLDGKLMERKVYYHWNSLYSNMIPSSIGKVLSPFDYGIRKNGEDISISSFLMNSDDVTLETIFQFIKDTMHNGRIDELQSQFLYILNSNNKVHYNPILSLKFARGVLDKVSLYVAPLFEKSWMSDYLSRTMETFAMKSHNNIRDMVHDFVTSKNMDLFMTAWDFCNDANLYYKVYLKNKNPLLVEDTFRRQIQELAPYLTVPGFRFCEIAFPFVNDCLTHYNLYYKPQLR